MRTENEIKALPLEDKQKLWVELRKVGTNDKAYANAKAIIEIITADKKWKEPETIEVKNVSGHEVAADDIKIAKDAMARVYFWQYMALARFLEPEEKIQAKLEKAGNEGREKDASAATITTKAAALIMFLFALCFGFSANAQQQTTIIGGPGQYRVQAIAGFNPGVIQAAMTTNFTAQIITTNTIFVPNVIFSNGVASFSTTTNYTYVTNAPGVISLAGYDQFTLSYSGAMMAGTTNVNSAANWDYSTDLQNWQSNKWVTPITMIGTGQVTTNLDVTGCNGGYVRLDNANNPANVPESNAWFEVSIKISAHGP